MASLQQLKKINTAKLKIFQIYSEDHLQEFMKGELAHLCGVDSILIQKRNSLAKKKGRYFFQCPMKRFSSHSVFFIKKEPFSSEEKKYLKSIGQDFCAGLKRIQMDNQLHLLKQQWKSAFNAIDKPICLTDGDYNILSTNHSFLKNMGKSKSDVYKKNCFLLFFGEPLSPKESQSICRSRFLKSMPGKNKVFEIHCQYVFKEKKEGALHLLIFTDMTKKIEIEKKIARLKESAEMGIVASSIAHELTNPLSGIQALLELSLGEKKAPVEEMLLAVRRCQKIVFQLLKSDSMPDLLKMSKTSEDKSLEISSP